MRSRILAVLFPAVLLAAALPARADEWTKKFTATGKPEIRVETNDGNVSVDAREGKEIEARVETIGWRIADNEVRVVATQTGDRIELTARVPRSWNWNVGGQRHSLRIELRIPREANLSIQTSDGNITLNGVRGEMRLSTGDGNIDASGLDGRFVASTGDGHLKIDGRFDLLDLRTGDGNVDARAAAGSKMAGSWTVRTGDGNVVLRLPEGFQADLDAHTGDGHISMDFPVTVTGSVGRSSLRGKMNGGGSTLTVRTGDGSIRLERL
jgi:hypothetical protein